MKRIAIHSVPRSGSTWLGEIFNSAPHTSYKYQPLFSYAFKNRLTPKSSLQEIKLFFDDINISQDDFINQTEARLNDKVAKFKKAKKATAVVYKEVRYHHILENLLHEDKNIKIIGLIRNPMAVVHSWLKAPREFRTDLGWNELEEWQYAEKKNKNLPEEFNGFEKWKETTNLFLSLEKEYPKQFKTVTYLDLINKTNETINELFSFCDMPITASTNNFIINSTNKNNNDPYSVFKTKENDDSWKDGLNKTIIGKIKNNLKNTHLEKYLY
jgi:hypothetical protein